MNKNTFSKVPTFFGNAPESWGRSWELDKHEPFSRALFTPTPHTRGPVDWWYTSCLDSFRLTKLLPGQPSGSDERELNRWKNEPLSTNTNTPYQPYPPGPTRHMSSPSKKPVSQEIGGQVCWKAEKNRQNGITPNSIIRNKILYTYSDIFGCVYNIITLFVVLSVCLFVCLFFVFVCLFCDLKKNTSTIVHSGIFRQIIVIDEKKTFIKEI